MTLDHHASHRSLRVGSPGSPTLHPLSYLSVCEFRALYQLNSPPDLPAEEWKGRMDVVGDSREPNLGGIAGRASDDLDQKLSSAAEPDLEGAFSDDGVDLTLIRWMLRQTPTERLRAAQQLIDAAWALRGSSET